VLRDADIAHEGQHLGNIVLHAELTGLVCSGARRGKHITFALLDERIPAQRPLDRPPQRCALLRGPAKPDLANRDAALAELAGRYFATRGPATLRDFVWWSGLTMADARTGAGAARGLVSETVDGVVYWRGRAQRSRPPAHRAYLLPPFDEYAVAYKDRELLGAPPRAATSWGALTLLGPIVVLDGVVAGTWRRTLGPRAVEIEVAPWRRLARDEADAVEQAAARYAAFLERPADVRVVGRSGSRSGSISRSRTS
jgi:hypothetical protein